MLQLLVTPSHSSRLSMGETYIVGCIMYAEVISQLIIYYSRWSWLLLPHNHQLIKKLQQSVLSFTAVPANSGY